MASPSNATALMNPQDIFLAFPRMLARAGNFAFFTVPEKLDGMLGFGNGGSIIAQATGGNGSKNILSAALSGGSGGAAQVSQGTAAATAAGAGAVTENAHGVFSSFTFHQVRNFGGIFSYMTSKWALACCCLVSDLLVDIYVANLERPALTSHRLSFSIALKYTPQLVVVSI